MGDSAHTNHIEGLSAQQRNDQVSVGTSSANKWAEYFGPASSEIKTNAYDKYVWSIWRQLFLPQCSELTFLNFFFHRYAYETYDLPEAYKGRNLFLRDTIDGFILEKNEWFTSVALPYAQTNDIHLAWNEWFVLEMLKIDDIVISLVTCF